jgi:hypothetical protein
MQSPEPLREKRFVPTPEKEMDDDRRLRVLLNRFVDEKFYPGSDGYYWYDLLVYDEAKGPDSARLVTEKTRYRALSATTTGVSGLVKGDVINITSFFSKLYDEYKAATEKNKDLRSFIESNLGMYEWYLWVELIPIRYVRRGDHFTSYGERYVVLGAKDGEILMIGNDKGEQKIVTGLLVCDKQSFRRAGEAA